MRRIILEATPNQLLSVFVDGDRYDLTFKETRGVMSCSVSRNGASLITGVRCLCGVPILPYEYMENGNFIFLTANNELPDWRQFGVSQNFLYITKAEVEELRGS